MDQPPCGNCPKKGCGAYHDECPEYQEYRQKRIDAREYRRQNMMMNSLMISPKRKDKFDRLK
jgi:hypothetical protein